jgi:hypothetical protein
MRHARLALALPVGLLTLAVVLPARLGGLVSAARCQQLLSPHSLPAVVAAIALAAVTTRTDSKNRVARRVKASAQAKPLNRSIRCHGAAHSHHNTSGMIGQMTAPSARMMLLALGQVQKTTISDDR